MRTNICAVLVFLVARVAFCDEAPTVDDVIRYARSADKNLNFPPGQLTIGKIGGPALNRVTVLQVVDDGHFRGEFLHNFGSEEHGNDYRKTEAIFTANTAGLVDGHVIDTGNQLFRVASTETYETAIGGTRTVFVIRRLPQEIVDAAVKQLEGEAFKAHARTWTDKKGVAFEAIYKSLKSGAVSLQKADGSVVEVKLADLVEADRRRALAEAKRAGHRDPSETKSGR
jgi:hypothetical protein